jgi:hypothetical protein
MHKEKKVIARILDLSERLESLRQQSENNPSKNKKAYLQNKVMLYSNMLEKSMQELDSMQITGFKKPYDLKDLKAYLQSEPLIDEKIKQNFTFNILRLPEDIKGEMLEDIKELNKCYSSGAYRCVVIICGRLIEIALHRMYYETTGIDILEKNPGIGLGKLIAKLSEKNVGLEPGLSQQIHLVNQVRIFSVHKKQKPFYPTKEQAEAIALFTVDAINKIFR